MAVGPILRPYGGTTLKPREFILKNYSCPDLFFCMDDQLYDIVWKQNGLHSALRSWHLNGRPKEKRQPLKAQAATLDKLVKDLHKDNELQFSLPDLRARLILREKKGFNLRPYDDSEDFLTHMCSYDIETTDWWTEDWLTDLIAFSFSTPGFEPVDFLVGTYPHDFQLRIAKYLQARNEFLARDRTAHFIRSSPVCITQNGINYDNSHLARREFNQEKEKWTIDQKFFPSEACIPFRVATAGEDGWGVKLLRKDGFDLDLMVHAINYFPESPDKKLETLETYLATLETLHFDGSSQPKRPKWSKSMTYAELDNAVERYRQTQDPKDIEPRLLYAEEDSRIPLTIAKRIIPILSRLAKLTAAPYQSIFNDAPAKIAKRWWDRFYHTTNNRPRLEQFDRKRKHLEVFDMDNFAPPRKPKTTQQDLFKEVTPKSDGRLEMAFNERKVQLLEAQTNGIPTGLHRNLHLYHGSPIAESLRPILPHKTIQKLYTLVEKAPAALERCIYLSMLDSFTREPLWDLVEHQRNPSHTKHFPAKYQASPEMVQATLDIGLENIFEQLRDLKLINFARNWFFTEKKGILDYHGLRHFGQADLISIAPGRVIYRFNEMLFSSGIKIPSKKKRMLEELVRVSQPEIKTRLQYDFLEKVFDHPTHAINYLRSVANRLAENKFDLEQYVWRVSVNDDPRFKTARARNMLNARVIDQLGGRQGDTLYTIAAQEVDGRPFFLGYDYGKKQAWIGTKRQHEPAHFDGEYFRTPNMVLTLDTRFYQDRILGANKSSKSMPWQVLRAMLPEMAMHTVQKLMYGFADKWDMEYLQEAVVRNNNC